MADMLTLNSGKPVRNDLPVKQERGRSGRNSGLVPVQSIGPLLRERREAMGVTLAEAEVATRIRQKYLAALEADEWDLLPGEVVGRGFLRNYSTYLGLEPTEMIERRRAVADESLAAALVNTSAGSALPPERKVDYRPKDVALKDEGDEIETPRQINWAPITAVLAIVAVAVLGFWAVTQLGPQMGEMVSAGQRQIAAWQAPPAQPNPQVAATLPANLVASTTDLPQATDVVSTPAAVAAPSDAAVPADTAGTTAIGAQTAAPAAAPAVDAQPAAPAEATPAEAAPAAGVSLLTLLPTPTPQPPLATAVPTAAPPAPSLNTAANLRGGPGLDYPVLAGLGVGQPLSITGISVDTLWYQLSDGSWVFGELVSNPPSNVPVVQPPPVPAPAVEAAPATP